MQVNIEINTTSHLEASTVKMALEKLAKNMNKSNLLFLAELSERKDINAKLDSKKTLIKTFI